MKYSVTDKQVIAQLAALINALPTAKPAIISPCPSDLAPAYELEFKDSSSAEPAAEVSIQCFGVMETLKGQSKATIYGGPASTSVLLQKTGSLLAGFMPKG